MISEEIKKDVFYLLCSFLFFFAFFFMNNEIPDVQGSRENINLTDVDEPSERCAPKYENRIFLNEERDSVMSCVKIAIPDNVYYDKLCEELGLTNEDFKEECLIE